MKVYLEDGCKWCGSQEWNDEVTDVDHASDCPVVLLRDIIAAWSDDYHCCSAAKARRCGRSREGGHDTACPIARAQAVLA